MANIDSPGLILKMWKKSQERYGVSTPDKSDKDAKKKATDKGKAAVKQSEKIAKGLMSLKQVTANGVKTPSQIQKFETTRDNVVLVMKKYCLAIKSANLEGAQDMNKLRKTAKQLTVVVAALHYQQLSNEEDGDANLNDLTAVDTTAFDQAMEDPNFAAGVEVDFQSDEAEANEIESSAVEDPTTTTPPQGELPVPPPTPDTASTPPSPGRQAELLTRLKGLMPAVQQAQAEGTETSKAILQRMNEASNYARQQDFTQAARVLDELEALLAKPETSPPSASPDGPAVLKRLNALTADMKVALAGPQAPRIQTLLVSVNGFLKNKEFEQARKALDELEALVRGADSPPTDFAVENLRKVREEWDAVRLQALQDLQRLKAILQDNYGGNPEEQAALAGAQQSLEASVTALNEDLGKQLDQVLDAVPAQRANPMKMAKEGVIRLEKAIQGNEMMSVIDGNEFAPDMQVAEPLLSKLQEIAQALG